jgi:hypothetical protein
MIHEEICTYEVCKLAREKGFPQEPKENNYSDIYDWDGLRKIHSLCNWAVWCMEGFNRKNLYAAPTQSLLQRWLRKEKGIVVEVIAQPTCSTSKKNCYWWSIKQNSDGFCYQYEECSYTLYSDEGYFDTYELALEDALAYSLKNLV